MPVYQPLLEISVKALEGLNNGTYELVGGVVREVNSKKIVEWAKDATKEVAEKSANAAPIISDAVKATTQVGMSTGAKVGIGIAIGTAAAAAVGFSIWCSYKFYKWITGEDKSEEKVEIKTTAKTQISNYHSSEVVEYIEHINNQTLSLKQIKKLMNFFDSISDGKNVTIEISDSEMAVLRNIITRYLQKLCEVNKVEIENKQLFIDAIEQPKQISLAEIKESLIIQEKIFATA